MTERADIAGIGRRISEIRREVGLTQEQLAERAGISVVHLCNIELGKKTPELTVLIRIAEALEVATDWILRAETPGTYAVANEKIVDLLEHSARLGILTEIRNRSRKIILSAGKNI